MNSKLLMENGELKMENEKNNSQFSTVNSQLNIPQLRFPEFEGDLLNQDVLNSFCEINPNTGELPDRFIYIDLESVNKGRLEKENWISKEGAPSRAQRVLQKGDILYQTVRPYQKNNYFFDKEGDYVASTGYAQIRTKQDEKYFFQYIHTSKFVNNVLKRCTGTSYPTIGTTDLAKVPITIPTPPEQTKIATFLTAVDKRINLLQKKKAELEQYKKGIMQKLFSQEIRFKPARPAGGQDEGSDFPDWESLKIKELFRFKQGVQCGVEKQSLIQKDGQIRFIRIVDLTKTDEPIRYIDDPGKEHHLNNNDLFMVRYGNAGLIGYGYQGVIANNLFRILPKNKDRINNKFYFFVFKMKQEKLEALASSSTMPALNFKALESLKLPFLFKEEQQKIANFLLSLDKSIEKLACQIDNSVVFKQGLLQKMFV